MKTFVSLVTTVWVMAGSPALFGQGQVFSLGPRLGVNIADVSNVDNSKASIGLVAGLTTTYSISQHFGLTLDILYSQEGTKSEDKIETNLDYLQIPVYFDVFFNDLGEAFRPKVYIGVAPGFLLNAKVEDVDVKNLYNSVVVSVTGGLGFNYRIADRVWLNTDLRAFHGLTDVREAEFKTDDNMAARNVQLSVGVAFGL